MKTCLSTLFTFAALSVSALPAAAAPDPQGFIYGKVTTRDGTLEGRLRWDDEEAFWGDYFNSSKRDRPHLDEVPRHSRREAVRIFGIRVGTRHEGEDSRSFVARFGDIRSLELRGRDRVRVTMKSGTVYDVDGGSNDVGADVFVWDRERGKVELDWRDIDRIDFSATPADLEVDVFRLHATVDTDSGEFRGWIQWDQEECLSTDLLDGDTRHDDVSIEMGKIRSIERRGWSSSRVTLKNGEEMILDDSNDVDDDNRGIYVEDPRWGRVLVSWEAFNRIDFDDPETSGPTYDDFAPGRPLVGAVTDDDGNVYRGRIVYDIDEAETWELINGENDDITYDLPLSLIRTIEPGRYSSRIVLTTGEEIELEDSVDVSDDSAGVLVLRDDSAGSVSDSIYLRWEDVRKIELEG